MPCRIESNVIINRYFIGIMNENTALFGIGNEILRNQRLRGTRFVKMNWVTAKNSFLPKVVELDSLNGLYHMGCVVDNRVSTDPVFRWIRFCGEDNVSTQESYFCRKLGFFALNFSGKDTGHCCL